MLRRMLQVWYNNIKRCVCPFSNLSSRPNKLIDRARGLENININSKQSPSKSKVRKKKNGKIIEIQLYGIQRHEKIRTNRCYAFIFSPTLTCRVWSTLVVGGRSTTSLTTARQKNRYLSFDHNSDCLICWGKELHVKIWVLIRIIFSPLKQTSCHSTINSSNMSTKPAFHHHHPK